MLGMTININNRLFEVIDVRLPNGGYMRENHRFIRIHRGECEARGVSMCRDFLAAGVKFTIMTPRGDVYVDFLSSINVGSRTVAEVVEYITELAKRRGFF